jgi:hypothetical protein
MKKLMMFILAAVLLMMNIPASAVDNPCLPDGYRTQTQGAWGQTCNGHGNKGCFRDSNWNAAFPAGLTVGGGFTIHFTSSAAVDAYLSNGGPSASLNQNYTNPTSTNAGNFAAQVTTLAVTMGFVNAGIPGFGPLGSLYYHHSIPMAGEPFTGMTVQQLFTLANEVLGGNTSNLPAGKSISDLNDVITEINENFDDGTHNNGNLVERECDQDHELPVELVGFEAVAGDQEITLQWNTASEYNIDYFLIERQSASGWNALAQINSQGDSPSGHNYTYIDHSVTEGILFNYRLSSRDFDGAIIVHDQIASASITGSSANATEYDLYQNYPNPFNPTTTISFTLPEAGNIRLVVFDVLGREIAVLANGHAEAGLHNVEFNASALSAGTYFYKLTAGDFSAVRKLMFVK